jgi:DNA (cytosine-5)-methyltransferase 1
MGYHQAGFTDIIGIDIVPQPNYPFTFIQADALQPPVSLNGFDLIHASPPCQAYSSGTPDRSKHPRLIGPAREMLRRSTTPWVIENVPGAPVVGTYMLCGTMFGLQTAAGLHLQRHRYFEATWTPEALGPVCHHRRGRTITVTGNGTTSGNRITLGRNVSVAEWREVMGIEWTTRSELAEAIPPAYTKFIGEQFLTQ